MRMRKEQSSRRRRAFTLIELLITVSVGSSIMLTSVALLHKSFQLQSLALERVQRSTALDRFIERFRSDAYLAAKCELLPESGLLLTYENGDQVEYSSQANWLARKQSTQRGLHVEQAWLGDSGSAQWDVLPGSKHCAIAIHDELPMREKYVARRIEVTIGRLSNLSSLSNAPALREENL